jgi:nitrate reductase NapAB chaperone NapD
MLMIIASWLVAVAPGPGQEVRNALAALPGVELRDKAGSRFIVLLSESTRDLGSLKEALLAVPGVHAAEPIACFDEDSAARELVRWPAA